MTTILSDTFTAASDTLLTAHAPGTGGTWNYYAAASDVDDVTVYGGSGYIGQPTNGTRLYYNSVDPGGADYPVAVTIDQSGVYTCNIGVAARVDPTGDNLYVFVYEVGNRLFTFYRRVAGSWTAIASPVDASSWVNGETHVMTLYPQGDTIQFLLDGVEIASATDSTITATGHPGIYMYSNDGRGLGEAALITSITADSGSGGGGGGDTTAPTVTSTNPVSSATGVLTTMHPVVTFSEAMDASTINSTNVKLRIGTTPITASVAYNSGTHSAVLTPSSSMAALTAHNFYVQDVTDVAGNPLATPFTSSFTTNDGSGPATLGYDTFAGADGVQVTDRPSASGHTWTSEIGNLNIVGNRATWPGSYGQRVVFSPTPTSNEYDIYFEVTPTTGFDGEPACYARWGSGSGYSFSVDGSRNRILWFINNSFSTASSDGSVPLTLGSTTTFKFQIRDATKKVFVGAGTLASSPTFTQIFTTTDNSITQVGQAAIAISNGFGMRIEALYMGEPDFVFVADTTPPVVTRGVVTPYGGQTAAIADVQATANKTAQMRVRWGTSTGTYTGGSTSFAGFYAGGVLATIPITGLPGGSTIYYVVDASDAAGNVGTSTQGTFTAPANDNTAPTFGTVTVSPINSGAGLNFAFTTSEAANVTVQVSTVSGNYTGALTVTDSAYPTSHSIDVPGTASGKTYYYKLTAIDPATNQTIRAEASYANPAINAATITRAKVSTRTKTFLVELRFNSDDNSDMTVTTRYKKHSEPDATWNSVDGGWRVGLPLERQDALDMWGRMMVNFFANLDPGSSYDLEFTITDPDGVTASSVPLEINDVATGTASISSVSGTVKKWTVTVDTVSGTLAAPGTPTHYLAPNGNDTTGDGSALTPWRTLNRAGTGMTAARIVQLAPGQYDPFSATPGYPITFVAQNLATASTTVVKSGRNRTKYVPANMGSRSVITGLLHFNPAGSGLPNAGQWVSVTTTGPATGQSHQMWKLTGLPTYKLGALMYTPSPTVEARALTGWEAKGGTYTPTTGTYAGLHFNMSDDAGFSEVVRKNDMHQYGGTQLGISKEIIARFPGDVDPNTLYVTLATYDDGTGPNITTPDVRFRGIEFRGTGVQVSPGAVRPVLDRNLFIDGSIVLKGNKDAVPNLRGSDLWCEYNVSMQTTVYDTNPANAHYIGHWDWVKGGLVIGGAYDPNPGWVRIGSGGQELDFIHMDGGCIRATIRGNTIIGWFNGIAGYSPGYDRFVAYHNECYDNWFQGIADDPFESEESCFGLLSIDNLFDGCLTVNSFSPCNFGPFLCYGAEISRPTTMTNFGVYAVPDGLPPQGSAIDGTKWGANMQNGARPHYYLWHTTFMGFEGGPSKGAEWSARSNGGDGATQGPPQFHIRNCLTRSVRYPGAWPSTSEEDYNDMITTDASRGFNVNEENTFNMTTYRLRMTNPAGRGIHTNLRSNGDLHSDNASQVVDAANGDFRLVSNSALIGAGYPVPYWDRPGIDFAGNTPDIGAVQTMTVSAPTISAVSPTTVSTAGGTLLHITGTGFRPEAEVLIGGNAATSVNVISATSMTCICPAHSAATADVVLTNFDDQTVTSTSAVTFTTPASPAVDVVSLSPTSGTTAGGTAVTITGTGFASGAAVTFGGVSATSIVVVSATSITCVTPAHVAGAVDVIVTNTTAQTDTLTSGYTYTAPATVTVTAISPNTGSTLGNTAVTITGTNFSSGATVLIGGTAATSVVVVNSTTITCVTPAHAASASDVVVTNTNNTSGTYINGFTFVTPATVTVTAITPPAGFTPGGALVTITGTAFSSGATVSFGGSAATSVTVVNSTTITCRIPTHGVGIVTVTVTNTDTTSGQLTNGFTYLAGGKGRRAFNDGFN